MTVTSKSCPQCGKTYSLDRRYCELDGRELTDVEDDLVDAAAGATPSASSKPALPREVVAGGILVLALVLIVGAAFLWRQSGVFRLRVTFDEAHGLKIGDSVFVRGADVGEVVDARFSGGRFVADVTLRRDGADQIRQGSLFFVGYDKVLMNRRCLVVYVPDGKQPPLPSGEEVRGIDSWFKYYGTLLRDKGPAEALRVYDEMKGLMKQSADAVGGKIMKP